MENASKALIIAGAILLAIAIIGVGMAVFNNASDSVSGTDISSEEVTAYNSEFDSYEGNAVRGSRVKTLIKTVKQHNLTATDDSEKVQVLTAAGETEVSVDEVDVEGAASTTGLQETSNAIQSGRTYQVSFGYDPSSGKITTIYVVQQGA